MNLFFKKLHLAPAIFAAALGLANTTGTASASADAGNPSSADNIVGSWETYDDETHLLTSIVRIARSADRADKAKADDHGVPHYEGYVDRIIPQPHEDPHPRCTKCTDARKNLPVLGMRIISHLRFSSRDHYDQGEILDPDNGEVYRLRVTIIEHNTKLDVRGYVGISLFGRSQIWRRVAGTPTAQNVQKEAIPVNGVPSKAPSTGSQGAHQATSQATPKPLP